MLTRRKMAVLVGSGAAWAAAGLPGPGAGAASALRTPIDFDIPRGACDCHVHVFPDPARFPFTPNRVYTPPVATAEDVLELQRSLRLDRVVVIQPSVYGTDNRAVLDGIRHLGPQRARGVAVTDERTTGAQLDEVGQVGIRGAGRGPIGRAGDGARAVLPRPELGLAGHQAASGLGRGPGRGRYVEAAVMTSVPPHGIRSPMLLGGPHAEAFAARAAALGMRATVFSPEVGDASAVKMCRSVVIKGLEALVTESMLAARRHGVERQVLASLADKLPHPDWTGLARYVMGRPLVHGKRRAKEMREAALTVREAGIEPMLSAATALRQDWAAARGCELATGTLAQGDLETLLDALLALPSLGGTTGAA